MQILKLNRIVIIVNPLKLITDEHGLAHELFEPLNFSAELPTEKTEAIIVSKTAIQGEVVYLLATKENKQFIAPASAIIEKPAVSEFEFYKWAFDSYLAKDPSILRQFAFTGNNPPSFEQAQSSPQDVMDQTGSALEPETEMAMQEAMEQQAPIAPAVAAAPAPAASEPQHPGDVL